jgi:hypothetical protein
MILKLIFDLEIAKLSKLNHQIHSHILTFLRKPI